MHSTKVLAAHLRYLLADLLGFASLCFMLTLVFDDVAAGYRCQWREPLFHAIAIGGMAAGLLWWGLERCRARAGLLPAPRTWRP